jgi:hypothetical protein
MKRLLLGASLALVCAGSANAQCVVVGDKTTGSWGVGYNNDGSPTSIKVCLDTARQRCGADGGYDCAPLYQGAEQGWCAIISGARSNGDILIELATGRASQDAAEAAVRKQYGTKGGLNAENVAAHGWYVYANTR